MRAILLAFLTLASLQSRAISVPGYEACSTILANKGVQTVIDELVANAGIDFTKKDDPDQRARYALVMALAQRGQLGNAMVQKGIRAINFKLRDDAGPWGVTDRYRAALLDGWRINFLAGDATVKAETFKNDKRTDRFGTARWAWSRNEITVLNDAFAEDGREAAALEELRRYHISDFARTLVFLADQQDKEALTRKLAVKLFSLGGFIYDPFATGHAPKWTEILVTPQAAADFPLLKKPVENVPADFFYKVVGAFAVLAHQGKAVEVHGFEQEGFTSKYIAELRSRDYRVEGKDVEGVFIEAIRVVVEMGYTYSIQSRTWIKL